jgi:hypothetical protein
MTQNATITKDGKVVPSSLIPKDLTPAQRAQLKLISHFAIIFVFNGVLAAVAYLSSGKLIGWQTIIVAAVAQATLALLDSLKKYFTASGQLPISTLIELASAEIASKAPTVQYSTNEQALQSAVNNLFAQDISVQPTSAIKPVTYSVTPADLKPNPTGIQAIAPVTLPTQQQQTNDPPVDAPRITTLPNIAAIQNQQQ